MTEIQELFAEHDDWTPQRERHFPARPREAKSFPMIVQLADGAERTFEITDFRVSGTDALVLWHLGAVVAGFAPGAWASFEVAVWEPEPAA